jgi:predicted nucleotidyltransferase component of viral defense system
MNAEIPIILKLKKENQKKIARAHDLIIKTLLKFIDDAVLHGGTAIWRCYNGNRFSEDIDAYLPRDLKKVNDFFDGLEKEGFSIEKKKISENSIYSALIFNRVIVRFEALFKKVEGILGDYKTSEGDIITISTLSPEQLIKEKVETYLKRRKIRDLYDIFFLIRHAKNKQDIEKELKKLIDNFKNPLDEPELKTLIIEGIAPSAEKMIDYIKSYIK